jgi:hypothetical protein
MGRLLGLNALLGSCCISATAGANSLSERKRAAPVREFVDSDVMIARVNLAILCRLNALTSICCISATPGVVGQPYGCLEFAPVQYQLYASHHGKKNNQCKIDNCWRKLP